MPIPSLRASNLAKTADENATSATAPRSLPQRIGQLRLLRAPSGDPMCPSDRAGEAWRRRVEHSEERQPAARPPPGARGVASLQQTGDLGGDPRGACERLRPACDRARPIRSGLTDVRERLAPSHAALSEAYRSRRADLVRFFTLRLGSSASACRREAPAATAAPAPSRIPIECAAPTSASRIGGSHRLTPADHREAPASAHSIHLSRTDARGHDRWLGYRLKTLLLRRHARGDRGYTRAAVAHPVVQPVESPLEVLQDHLASPRLHLPPGADLGDRPAASDAPARAALETANLDAG